MKLFIASDIHGSMHYCSKMLDAFKKEGAHKLVLLGDILYHGPRNDLPKGYSPKEAINALNEFAKEIICVRGNCDTEVDQMVLDFPIMAEYAIISDGETNMYLTHGHNSESLKSLLKKSGGILLCGHTHVPGHVSAGGLLCINPGSVSIPKENSPHSYMIYEDKTFVWKTLEGQVFDRYSFNKG